jgi:hypothetical protein
MDLWEGDWKRGIVPVGLDNRRRGEITAEYLPD